jgi:trimeric autotransporter adhesin
MASEIEAKKAVALTVRAVDPFTTVVNPVSSPTPDETKKNKRKAAAAAPFCCKPAILAVLAALAIVAALAIGLGVGLSGGSSSPSGSPSPPLSTVVRAKLVKLEIPLIGGSSSAASSIITQPLGANDTAPFGSVLRRALASAAGVSSSSVSVVSASTNATTVPDLLHLLNATSLPASLSEILGAYNASLSSNNRTAATGSSWTFGPQDLLNADTLSLPSSSGPARLLGHARRLVSTSNDTAQCVNVTEMFGATGTVPFTTVGVQIVLPQELFLNSSGSGQTTDEAAAAYLSSLLTVWSNITTAAPMRQALASWQNCTGVPSAASESLIQSYAPSSIDVVADIIQQKNESSGALSVIDVVPSPTPSPSTSASSSTPTPSVTPTSSVTPTPSSSTLVQPSATSTPTPSTTPTPSNTPTPSATPTSSQTGTPSPTVSDSPTPSITPSPTPSATPSTTPSPTPTISTSPLPLFMPPRLYPVNLTSQMLGVQFNVNALAAYNGKLYVGGPFTTLGNGTSAKRISAWDGSAWSTLASGASNGVGNNVNALAVFGGKLYVGGTFTLLGDGTTSAKYIAAWDGSAWSTLTSGASNGLSNGPVSALAAYNGKLYVGGAFTLLGNGTSARYIAAWDGSAWSNLRIGSVNGVQSNVNALAAYSGKLYVGGLFTTLSDGTSTNRIAAWDGSAWSTLASGASNGVGGAVNSLTEYNGKLYAGGGFTLLGDGTTSAKYVAAWDGSAWSTLASGASNGVSSGPVSALAEDSGKLFVGGSFTTLGDGTTSAKRIAAWDGNAWSTLASGASNGVGGAVSALAAYNGKLHVGGQFSYLGDESTAAHYIAVVSSNTLAPIVGATKLNAGFVGSSLSAMATYAGSTYFGGSFVGLADGSIACRSIVAWDGGSTWSTLASGASNGVIGEVIALAAYNGKLYVGGAFTLLGDGTTSAKYIASWDGSAWSTLTSGASNGVSNSVYALAAYNGKLYVGGAFNLLGDGTTTARYIAAWDGSAWSTLASGASNGLGSAVNALAEYSGKLYVGGAFSNLGSSSSAKCITAWDGSAWSTLASGASNGLNGNGPAVYALTEYNGKLFVGGDYTSLGNGTSANRIAAWDGSAWSTLASGASNGVGGTVYGLAAHNGTLAVGGSFTVLGDGNSSAKYIATTDGSVMSPMPTFPTLTGMARRLFLLGGRLFFMGSFGLFSDSTPANFVAYVM